MIHIDKIDGYQIFTHNPKAKEISDAVRKILATKKNNIKVKLNPIKRDNIDETSFEDRCRDYFKGNFETLATDAPLILPCKEPEKFKEIVKTMERWCEKTNKSSKIKGLVLHSFSVFRHLEHFGFTREALKEKLEIKTISEAPVIVVYNPLENVVLLIRNSEKLNLTNEIKHGLDDLKMFIMLFNDKLVNSNLKLISLVVTNKAHEIKLECLDCKNNVLSQEEFKDLPTFENWWEERATYYEKREVRNNNPDFIRGFVAKITGTVAATFIYDKYIPTLTDKPDEQMANLAVLLTREQMEIVYSQDKHIIIRGGFGCGKTIIAAAMLKKIADSLKTDEKLYYICYDSRSELLYKVAKDTQENNAAKITPFHNKERRNLSEIVKGILEKKESTRKINFVVDEYDGEDLDESEAKSLNNVFNESLKEMFIVMILQPIEKKRVINNIQQNRNRFELLDNMKLCELNQVMRNSVEIHNLIKLTTDVLQKQKTVFIYQENNKMKTDVLNISVLGTNSKTKSYGLDINGNILLTQTDAPKHPKEKLRLVEVKDFPRSVKGACHGDLHEYPEEISSISKLGLDEAQAVSGSVNVTGSEGVNKTISEFLIAKADKTGHKISSNKPLFLN